MPFQDLTKEKRNQIGFTLSFAVILCVVFASLLYIIFYFLKLNIKESNKAIYREKATYLAESGNNRAMARLNVKTLPDTTGLNLEDDDEDFDDEEFDDDFFGDDDDDFFDDFDDEDFDDDDDFFDEDDKTFLTKIPRYVNFYLIDPFYVNIDTGAVITQAGYLALVAQQQNRIQINKQQAQSQGVDDYQFDEILIEELYFPLPEVNVSKIGSIPIKKGIHMKPGFKLTLAEKVPINLKRPSIVDEYYNLVPDFEYKPPRPLITNISPNYAHPGEYLDIYFEGENYEGSDAKPEFSSGDIALIEYNSGTASIGLSEKAKTGRVQMKFAGNQIDFFIVPEETTDPTAIINEVLLPKPKEGERQFIKMGSKDKIEGITITGENLSLRGIAPVIVPDSPAIKIDVTSYRNSEIKFTIETKKASLGIHYFSIFTPGGQSSSWAFNIEKTSELVNNTDPNIGTYSTIATLLEANSLANMPIRSYIDASATGRPSGGGDEGGGSNSGRPDNGRAGSSRKRNFDLLKSDLELVWKLETIATVNKRSFKEIRIVRRTIPKARAGLITNAEMSFSQSSIVFEGLLEALTILNEPSSDGDTKIFVEGEDPDESLFESRSSRPPLVPTGSAVVEDFQFGSRGRDPAGKGFRKGGVITVISSNRSSTYSDFSFVKETGPNYIVVEDPGFKESHFTGDEVIQFTPAILTPERIRERDAQRNLDPPGAVAYLPNRENFEYIFRTKLDKLASWGGGYITDTKVPDDFDELYEGYFGMNIISGTPSYTGANSLYGQGLLIIDTTKRGQNPGGGTVTLGGSTKLPSTFEGVIYIIGDLNISGPVEITGSIIVNSPRDNSVIRVSGSGNVSYNAASINKSIIGMPFTEDLRTRIIEPSGGESEIVGGKK